jgi:WD40 repeat protein
MKGHSQYVSSAVFSPDGMHIVSASYDKTAQIWNTFTAECEALLKHSDCVTSAIFSPDGLHILSTSYDYTAWIWDIATGECEAKLKHPHFVNSAIFSSDGMHVVSASDDSTARIWNMITRECEAVWKLDEHTSILSLHDKRQLFPIPDGVFIHSDFEGLISASSQPSLLNIYNNSIFHTINLHKICAPPPYRNPSTITYYLSKICLGYPSGEILLLEVCMPFIILYNYY